ncbi:unnamed protein product [Calypogeia fissa]
MQSSRAAVGRVNVRWMLLVLLAFGSAVVVVVGSRSSSVDKILHHKQPAARVFRKFARYWETAWSSRSSSEKYRQQQHGLELNNGLGQTPQMGWNSWNHFGCNVDEDIIYQTAEALVKTGLADVGYKYVNIDDCWAELSRDSEGNLVPRAATFGSGIKALADHVHNLGLKLGIYSDAGEYTCQKQPGSLGYEDKDAEAFASWEVDYLKYDNCYNDGSPPEIRYPIMRDALNKTGRQIFFSMCEWGEDDPALWAKAVGNSWRTTEDIQDKWKSMVKIVDENDVWADFAGSGGWNDPDMLEVGNGGMTLTEYQTHFSLWALVKAPLLIGCDVRNLSSDVLRILSNKDVIAVNQDPLGVQGKKVSTVPWWWQWWKKPEVWSGPLSGGRTVVLLWNRAIKKDTVTVTWADIGLSPGIKVIVQDLWEHETWTAIAKDGIQAQLPPHGSQMLILTPVSHASLRAGSSVPRHRSS